MTKSAILFLALSASLRSQVAPVAVVVAMPSTGSETFTLGGPLSTSLAVMMTSDLNPSTRLSAMATLPTGTVSLFDDLIKRPAFFVQQHCGAIPSRACLDAGRSAGPDIYPLSGGMGQVPSLPSATPVVITVVAPGQDAFHMTTETFLRGVAQSPDLMTITVAGTFDPSTPTYVYFGFWPIAAKATAVTITSSTISIDLALDKTTFAVPTGWYAITVVQNNVCDSVMMQFRSVFPNRREGTVPGRIQ